MIELTFNTIVLRYDSQRWWLIQMDGEGMEISVTEIENILQNYYTGNF